jgi:transmembrane protein
MIDGIIRVILTARSTSHVARVLLTLPFWSNGLMKLFDFSGGIAEMEHFGFLPGAAFNLATIILHLTASILIITGRWVWLGAGALGIFNALTILLVHRFWTMEGHQAIITLYTVEEHIGMIGGLILVSILAARQEEAAT